MSLEMNANLTKLNNLAIVAMRHEDLSGEDSVIHATQANPQKLVAGRSQMLGFRSAELKQGSLAARKIFFASVCEQFGGFNKIPESVRAVMKLADFKLDAEGNVTSGRPLTSRRITTVCAAIREYNSSHDPAKFDATKAADYDKLTAKMQDEYRDYVASEARALSTAGSTNLAKLSVACFLQTKLVALQAQAGGVAPSARETFGAIVDTLKDDFRGGEVSNASALCLELAATLVTARQDVLALVRTRGANLPAQDQALLFQECVANLEKRIAELSREIYMNPGAAPKKLDVSAAGLLKGTNFTVKPPRASLTADGAHAFMKAYIDQYRNEFLNCKGNVNEKFHGKCGNKYENLLDALRCFKDLKNDTVLAGLITKAIAESVEFPGSKREASYFRMIERNRQKAAAEGKPFEEPMKNPCYAMPSGKEIDRRLEKIMDATSHTKSNSASQIGEAYDIFCDIPNYFFQALNEDRANGDTRLFDQLMDALNTTGCLQARCEALQNVRIALNPELRGVKDDTVSGLSLFDGLAKVAQSLQKNANDEIDYETAVKRYVEAMAKGGKPGEATLGANIPGLGEKDSRITITSDFLMKPEVAAIVKDVLGVFKD